MCSFRVCVQLPTAKECYSLHDADGRACSGSSCCRLLFPEKYTKGRFLKNAVLFLLMLGQLQHRACLDKHCGPNSFAICAWCSCAEGASLIKASFLGRRFNCPLGAGPHLCLLAMCFSQKRCSWKTFLCSLSLLLHCCCETTLNFFFLFQKKNFWDIPILPAKTTEGTLGTVN